MQIKRHLITTADERTWKLDSPVLFLGEWCRLYDRNAVWDKMDFGLNTSDTRFALKDSTLMAFNLFWPNAPKKVYNYSNETVAIVILTLFNPN